MTGSAAIAVAIGLVFTFFVFSSICSAIKEAIARVLNSRGTALFSTINALIGDAELAKDFWQHPLVTGLMKSRSKAPAVHDELAKVVTATAAGATKIKRAEAKILPSYMSAATFATAINQVLAAKPLPAGAEADGVRKVVAGLAAAAQGDAQHLQASLETWFNDAMNRLSGWYKRRSQVIVLVLAAIVTIGFNVSTVHVAEDLWRQPALAAVITQQAAATTPTTAPTTPTGATTTTTLSAQQAFQDASSLPVGWAAANRPTGGGQWLLMLLGWLLTIGALTLGAPFWFDLLSRLGPLAATGPPSAP